ncbi:Transcriptional regulator, contains XRE-family HTH domain [Paenibacillus sp. UNCCL117]|uniref:helix-turn-helix domain-containing protein n=1 Tax=unclassified Paenibacillus TaxID=185978 RepID=UPI00087FD93B|nr:MULTISPECIES: helix-turn-helix domain-containing protein [unclassified Paenibacillus]SDC68941.1 Transcriptional regulator, contains XRE-family HTH domain [Paenibacillus sp. cl123]SFW23766.1 Transcriptional regulator, contains XRE-family HTH domain [Paenibacillus sp. UNCCL117]
MFHERLKNLREERKIRQMDVASKIGIARTTYASYEQGFREPDQSTLLKIADFFKVDIDYLLGRADTPFSNPSSHDPLNDPEMQLFFKDWDKLSPERQEEVKAFMRAQLRIQEEINNHKK